jgi:PAS domain-containing protein
MTLRQLTDLLAAWRFADRRWEKTASDDPALRESAIAVVRTWLAYHLAAGDYPPGEIALVADDDRIYVAVSPGVIDTLGYLPAELLGKRVEDLGRPEHAGSTGLSWSRFIQDGRQDGVFPLVTKDGLEILLNYQARSHFPIAGFHLSRLWPR